MAVEDTGGPLKAPVGKAVLSRMFDVFGNTIDREAALSDVEWRSVHRAPPSLARRSTKSVQAAGTDDPDRVAAQMRKMKINDFMTKDGWIREDGRVMRDMYLEEVKSSAESKYPFDYFKILATIPAEQAFRPLKDGGCSLVHG
jgi:hypothetical protein